jgi:hypothetical protein
MLPFDPSTYMKTVLAPVAAGGPMPDMFARYLLETDDEDDAAVGARLSEVKAHWHKLEGKGNVKYTELLKRLINEHKVAEISLLKAGDRRKAAEKARSERAKENAHRERDREQFEQQLGEVLARANGLTSHDRRMLEEFSRGLSLDAAMVAARLDSCPVLDDAAAVQALPDNVRERVHKALANYGAVAESPLVGLSLFHVLGFTGPELDPARLKASYELAYAAQRGLNTLHPAKTAMASVVELAKMYLVEGDPAVYLATLAVDVREALKPMAARAAIDDGAIDELESEQLLRAAQERGLPAQEARGIVSELARDLQVELRFAAPVDYIACANCGRPHPAESAPERCTRCGEALFRNCPSCNARSPASDTACTSCGADLAGYMRAVKALADARLALESGLVAYAASLLESVPGNTLDADGRALSTEIERKLKQARSEWEVIEREIGERRLYSAMLHLAQLEQRAVDVPGPLDLVPSERLPAIAERIRAVDALLSRARSTNSKEERETLLARALEEAADCREAEQQLALIPPGQVKEVTASFDHNALRVAWAPSPSPGPTRYRVLRALGRSGAGAEVQLTDALYFTDPDAPAGEALSYGVICERAGAQGQARWSSEVMLAREVEGLAITERDGEIALAWSALPANARAEVERREEATGDVQMLNGARAGMIDRDVRNGSRYRYVVRVAYTGLDGAQIRTEGAALSGSPAHRPEPVGVLGAQADGSRVKLIFTAPEDTSVSVFRCSERPAFEPGEELSEAELATVGELLPVDPDGAYDPHPTGIAWYLPVSRSGSYAVAGRPIRHLGLKPITDVRASDLATSVRVTWSWPEQTKAAVVVWRRDRQPIDADDPSAMRRTLTQAEYEELGGVELQTPGEEPVFVAVFAAARIDGELLASSVADRRARLALRKTAKIDVCYAVRRSGLRKRQVSFEVTAPDTPPDLVLVARPGELLPRSADDGRVIARLGGNEGARVGEFDLGQLGRPVAVRIFFGSQAADSTHRLREPDTRELVFR